MKKCDFCGEKCEDYTITPDGKIMCEGCKEEEMQYPSTLMIFGPGQIEVKNFTRNLEELETGKMPDPIIKEKWVSTDAWRGYTDWEIKKGFTVIADGWITGFPDETTQRKIDLHELFSDLQNQKIVAPRKLYWIFGITSNVFSTASKVVVKNEDLGVIRKWLNEIDGGQEGLQEMLS